MDCLTRFRVNTPNVVCESFDDEVILVHLVSCNYYSLDETGLHIWRFIEEGLSLDGVARRLHALYDGTLEEIRTAVATLIERLEDEQLIVRLDEEAAAVADIECSQSRPPFQPPTLSRFTDMQDLLALDPIHDVDEAGWPSQPSAPEAAGNSK